MPAELVGRVELADVVGVGVGVFVRGSEFGGWRGVRGMRSVGGAMGAGVAFVVQRLSRGVDGWE